MKRLSFVVALLVVVSLVVLLKTPRVAPPAPPSATHSSPAPTNSTPTPDRSPLADTLNSPATDIRADLRLVSLLLETYRSNFLHTGNPVGTNAEITAALTGRNPLKLSLIPPDHPAIDRAGELCDRWGTPFFFHQISGQQMEIRSAGPDRKLYTDDDVVSSP